MSSNNSTKTKAIIRNLPPDLPEKTLSQLIFTKFTPNYFQFTQSSPSSYCHISFSSNKELQEFNKYFNGWKFQKERIYYVQIEYAINQSLPKNKKDLKEGGIFSEKDYLDFIIELNENGLTKDGEENKEVLVKESAWDGLLLKKGKKVILKGNLSGISLNKEKKKRYNNNRKKKKQQSVQQSQSQQK